MSKNTPIDLTNCKPDSGEFTCWVMGIAHYDYNQVKGNIVVDQLLDIVPEPENHYDQYAHKICLGPFHIGYIPKKATFMLGTIRATHKNVVMLAQVTKHIVNPEKPLYCPLEVKVVYRKGEGE